MQVAQQVFIHIGLTQRSLQENGEALSDSGVLYLKTAQHSLFKDSGHHLLAISLMKADWGAMQLNLSEADIRRAWSLARQEISEARESVAIISSEWSVFEVHTDAQMQQLKAHLSGFEVFVVVTLRNVVGFANSLYAQRIRDGFAGMPAEFIKETWPLLNWLDITHR